MFGLSSLIQLSAPQFEVQTEIGLRSDAVERTTVCSQTEITGSGRKFERTTVWTMVWRWSDQRWFWSEKSGPWSGNGLIRGQFGLKSLIIGGFERIWVWSEATSSAIGSDITYSSALWSDQRHLRAQLGLTITSSSALGSDQKCFRTQLGLIRDLFERLIFLLFIFLLIFFCYWEMLALPRGINKAAFWSETHLKTDSCDQKKGVSW